MNQKTINILLAIGLFFSLGWNLYISTRDKKIVYVDIQKLVMKHKRMQSQLNNNQSLQKIVKLRLDTLSNEITLLDKEISSGKISTKEKAQKQALLKRLEMDKVRYQQESIRGMQEADQLKMQQILAETNVFIKDYAERHGYQYVLGATQLGNLLYAQENVNITDRLLDQINK